MEHVSRIIDACLACSIECESCVTSCIHSNYINHLKCVALCRDCADLCSLCARFAARGSYYYDAVCKICVELCTACALECEKLSDHDCCKACAEVCRRCVSVCAFQL